MNLIPVLPLLVPPATTTYTNASAYQSVDYQNTAAQPILPDPTASDAAAAPAYSAGPVEKAPDTFKPVTL